MLHVKKEVDPIYEIAGIAKSFEKGPILKFEKIKGYPDSLTSVMYSGGVYRGLIFLASKTPTK